MLDLLSHDILHSKGIYIIYIYNIYVLVYIYINHSMMHITYDTHSDIDKTCNNSITTHSRPKMRSKMMK